MGAEDGRVEPDHIPRRSLTHCIDCSFCFRMHGNCLRNTRNDVSDEKSLRLRLDRASERIQEAD
jgi:hypothetical protein